MKKIITLLLLLFSTMVVCNSQTKQTMYQSAQNKTSSNISIESPIKAILNVYVDNENLIGEVSLTNISDKNVILNDKMIGSKTLNERVFFAKVLPLQPNLTFKRHSTFSDMIFGIEIEYVTIKPNQTIITKTELNDYFNFREKNTILLLYCLIPKCHYMMKIMSKFTK